MDELTVNKEKLDINKKGENEKMNENRDNSNVDFIYEDKFKKKLNKELTLKKMIENQRKNEAKNQLNESNITKVKNKLNMHDDEWINIKDQTNDKKDKAEKRYNTRSKKKLTKNMEDASFEEEEVVMTKKSKKIMDTKKKWMVKSKFESWLEYCENGEYAKKLPNVYLLMDNIDKEKIESWKFYNVLCILIEKCSTNEEKQTRMMNHLGNIISKNGKNQIGSYDILATIIIEVIKK